MYGALLNGASLYPLDVKQQGLTHPAKWLIQHQITIYRSFSTLFRHFVTNLDRRAIFPTPVALLGWRTGVQERRRAI